jgi:pimeloyl-ACP methyl ester carboxylesterase
VAAGSGEAEAREAMSAVSTVDPRVTEKVVAGRTCEGFNLGETLQSIACPALLLAGEVSLGGLIRDEDIELFSSSLPNARITRISGGGHGIVWDEPARTVNDEIVGFLGSL